MNIPAPALSLLEIAFNRALELDPDARQRLVALSGKVIVVELLGLDLRLYFLPALDGVQIAGSCKREPDTVIRGAPGTLLHVAITQDRKPLFEGEVEITGDIELGQRFNRILQNIDIDWEEPLSRLVGDVAAHQIGNVARGVLQWLNYAASSFARDTAEYLQEESRDLPAKNEVDAFYNQVERTRADVDRLAKRIERLQRQYEEPQS